MCADLHLNIKKFYRPIQPWVQASANAVTYREMPPAAPLQPFIYCYWELKTREILSEPFVYNIVADGCIDIIFETSRPEASFIMGFFETHKQESVGTEFHYAGIRFLPGMFTHLHRIAAVELSDRCEDLMLVAPEVAKFISNNFSAFQSLEHLKQCLDAYFLNHLGRIELKTDHRFWEALHLILTKSGVLLIEGDIDAAVSQRQLRRLFDYYVGASPKAFSKVVRFQSFLNAQPSTQRLKKHNLYFDFGYSDQSHFIREFKAFYGVTPAKAFAESD